MSFAVGYLALVAMLLFVTQAREYTQAGFGVAFLVLLFFLGLALARPAAALGAVAVFAVVGDNVAMPWWPVAKNLSAAESVLYVSDEAVLRPLDMVLIMVLAAVLLNRGLAPGAKPLHPGQFWVPITVFTLALFTGLVWGMIRRGDFQVAAFEFAPLLYIPLVYVAATNLFTTMAHYRHLLMGIAFGTTIESLHTLSQLADIRENIATDHSPLEHTAALHMNLLFLLLVATRWFGTSAKGKGILLFLMTLPTAYIFVDAQRRAAVVALLVGMVVLVVVLFSQNRRRFMFIVPIMTLVAVAYVGAFWGSESSLAFPAQAVKSVVAPTEASAADASSDLYRQIENFNLHATIRTNPILGIGLGHPFHRPLPLPNLSSSFVFGPYIPHNSILGLWTKLGLAGIFSYFFLTAAATARGVQAALGLKRPDDIATVAVITAYVPMMMTLAFVEITFDATSTLLLGFALALTGSVERLTGAGGIGAGDSTDTHCTEGESDQLVSVV